MPTSIFALGLVLALTPGVIFRWSYISAAMPRRLGTAAASDEIVWFSVGSMATYVSLWGLFALVAAINPEWVWGPHASTVLRPRLAQEGPKLLALLLSSDSKIQAEAVEKILMHAPQIVFTCGLACVVSFLLGIGAWKAVRASELDLRFNLLRIPNDWYYILSGREFGADRCDLVWVWALVDVGGMAMLYRGILREYFPTNDGGLESIALTKAERAPIKEDGTIGDFFGIAGNTFVLKYSELQNFNMEFVYIDETNGASLPPPIVGQPDYPMA